jgi:hypothetical protein
MKTLLFLFGVLFASTALGAPADDGQSAGSRSWVLNQGRIFVAVTPSDGTDLVLAPTRAVLTAGAAGAACVLTVIGADDTASVALTIAPGIAHPFQVKRILATGTTCTSIVAIY